MKNFFNESKNRMSEIAREERPRERLTRLGVSSLSDIELLCLMLGSGSSKRPVWPLATDLLNVLENGTDSPQIENLLSINGIGIARACLVSASLEFARRRIRPSLKRIEHPSDVLPMLRHWSDRPQEYFLVMSLNGAHEVLRLRVVSKGILDKTIVHPREVFVDVLSDRASAIICAHNHPSGTLNPSNEDKELTTRLKKSGMLLGIPLLDHIIFTETGYFSFLENDIME